MDPVTDTKSIIDIAKALDTYGPWAVMTVTIAIAILVVKWLSTRANAQVVTVTEQIRALQLQLDQKDRIIAMKDEQILSLVEKRHVEFTSMMGETVAALATASDVNEKMIKLMERCDRKIG